MAPLDNKISNVLGKDLPFWLKNQIKLRSEYNNQSNRDDLNIAYLGNQTSWVRLVSSININKGVDGGFSGDMNYFKNTLGIANIEKPEDLAKKYMLFGGVTQYINKNQNQLRFGLGQDGAYGTLGDQEINKYGYRPMPGISDVKIETQGRLGSIRMATINFKVWDKSQLDVIDALYFKLGYTMLLEWGHTVYIHRNKNSDIEFQYSELLALDPFEPSTTKEKINLQLAQNSRLSEGNYDGMLGIVTNFNFSFTQEGGYDCSVKIVGLGAIGDSIKINNTSNLPNVVQSELKSYYIALSTAQKIAKEKAIQEEVAKKIAEVDNNINQQISKSIPFLTYVADTINPERQNKGQYPTNIELQEIIKSNGLLNSNIKYTENLLIDKNKFDFFIKGSYFKHDLYLQKFGVVIFQDQDKVKAQIQSILLDRNLIISKLNESWSLNGIDRKTNTAYKTIYEYLNNIRFNLLGSTGNASNQNAYSFTINYEGYGNKTYSLEIVITLPQDITFDNISKTLDASLQEILTNQSLDFKDIQLDDWSISQDDITKRDYRLTLSSTYNTDIQVNKEVSNKNLVINQADAKNITTSVKETITVHYSIIIHDSALISNIALKPDAQKFTEYLKYEQDQQNQKIKDDAAKQQVAESDGQPSIDAQVDSSLKYQSNLELAIKAIELYSLTQAIKESSVDIGQIVKKYSLSSSPHRKNFLKSIFQYTIFGSFLDDLFDGKITDDVNYGSEEDYINNLIKSNDDIKFKIFSKYGFNSSIMGGKSHAIIGNNKVGIPQVNYSELTTTYIIPYNTNQPLEGGGQIIHPVYVQLGFLLMIINAMSTIYESDSKDTNNSSSQNKPLIYIDYNLETNLCLTNSLQFTTNPFSFMIPLQATLEDYKSLFLASTIDNSTDSIKAPTSGSSDKLYQLHGSKANQLDPNISGRLPEFRAGGNIGAYRGKTMKILVSCEYILSMIKQFADGNGLNKAFLKPFLDQLVTDMNKSLGAMNIFRVAYDDTSNCFAIVDDQVQPLAEGESPVTQNATDAMPVYGVNSIAKSVNIQTEIPSNLANMVAISANSNPSDQSANSTNASSFGFINNSYKDRYVPVRKDLTINEIKAQKARELAAVATNYDSILKAEQKFNAAIRSFYGSIDPNKDDISQATNYYIEASSKTNNTQGPTRSSAMIPVSVNFTTRGISGFHMGHAFTLPPEILPYTYTSRNTPTIKDVTANDPSSDVKVAFATVGLSHTIQNNVWDTSIKGSMILIKDQKVYSNSKIATSYGNAPLLKVIAPGAVAIDPKALNVSGDWLNRAFQYISSKEGFEPVAKWDVDHFRGGYGSDKKLVGNQLQTVVQGTTFTTKEAEDTLKYEIATDYSKRVIRAIGQEAWDKISDNQKAALTSFAYNAGTAYPGIFGAVKSGNYNEAAQLIAAGPYTSEGKYMAGLETRRKEESALFNKTT